MRQVQVVFHNKHAIAMKGTLEFFVNSAFLETIMPELKIFGADFCGLRIEARGPQEGCVEGPSEKLLQTIRLHLSSSGIGPGTPVPNLILRVENVDAKAVQPGGSCIA